MHRLLEVCILNPELLGLHKEDANTSKPTSWPQQWRRRTGLLHLRLVVPVYLPPTNGANKTSGPGTIYRLRFRIVSRVAAAAAASLAPGSWQNVALRVTNLATKPVSAGLADTWAPRRGDGDNNGHNPSMGVSGAEGNLVEVFINCQRIARRQLFLPTEVDQPAKVPSSLENDVKSAVRRVDCTDLDVGCVGSPKGQDNEAEDVHKCPRLTGVLGGGEDGDMMSEKPLTVSRSGWLHYLFACG
ncbi:unnamed protein product [Protopolystoma xenopodis]|uniref:Uncharacterized protein n=1 Tax=Protopolystoma xenopodis TaxID=117903 RepID=A0A448WTG5_9PLAT|nr:unnamed protein product [Protopolystoma xenopodis]